MSHPFQSAKHARGPNTPQGKIRSSQNAVRHGLTGRIVVLPTEDMEVYKAFSKELVDSLHPETPMERQLAQTIADTQWRLNRARTIEDGMLAWDTQARMLTPAGPPARRSTPPSPPPESSATTQKPSST
ncbi:MAG TPA: hypothetical protein VG273_23845 [Bryobacteraceae bacterium]|jgi:hypothetical protein|nr:hypothetical protein [Bryobacteraceae bacterium]